MVPIWLIEVATGSSLKNSSIESFAFMYSSFKGDNSWGLLKNSTALNAEGKLKKNRRVGTRKKTRGFRDSKADWLMPTKTGKPLSSYYGNDLTINQSSYQLTDKN